VENTATANVDIQPIRTDTSATVDDAGLTLQPWRLRVHADVIIIHRHDERKSIAGFSRP